MANMINVVVRDAESPEDDIVVPDTGWYTSSTESHNTSNFVAPIITTGAISFVVLLLLILAKRKYSLVDSFSIQTKKKWRTVKCLGILAILATFVTSMSFHSIINKNAVASDNLISITSSDTTITIIREANDTETSTEIDETEEPTTSFGIATATIKLNESTPLGYNIYAYTPDGNILKPITTNASNESNTGNEANTGNESNTTDAVINPVSSNNSPLSNNTWGIALTNAEDIKPEDTIWNIVGDESNAILVASFDESTAPNTTITLRFGVLVDSTLPTGVYSANIEYKAYQRAYSITFNAGEGEITTPTKPVMIGEAIGELPVPTRTNYNFLGWYTEQTGGTKIDENTIPSQNSTYYAHWERITYNIIFNPTEGTITTGDTEKTVLAGDTLGTLPEATRANYIFTGWYTELTGGERVTTSTIPESTTTYYAHWSRDTYTITFNAGEGTIDPQDQEISINAGDPIGTLPNATRTNYTLAGWYTAETEGTIIDENTIPSGPTTYYAHWTRNEYTITFNLMGGNIAGDTTNPTATVLAGDTLTTLPTEPTKTNYTFNGWWTEETDGTQVTTGTTPDGTTTYYAHWTRNEYTITFNLMGGNIAGDTTNPTATVLAGDTLTTLPTEPTKENYTFNGWWTEETDGTQVTAETRPEGTTTYYAHWTRNEYTITYNLMGGNIAGDTTNPTATVLAGNTLTTLPTEPTKENYTFNGWWTEETDGTQVTTETRPEGTTTYFAHWTRNEYTITYNLMGGNIAGDTTNPTATVLAGNTLTTLPTEPTKDDLIFNGWWTEETGGTAVTTETVPDGNLTYYAHWTEAIVPCNPNATTIGTGNSTDAVCMQDVASMSKTALAGAINNMAAETNYTLRDSRDDQDYTVAKLRDGKIWMTKNMNLSGETKLYSDDSDVPSGYNKGEGANANPYYTLPASSTTGFDDNTKAFVYNSGTQTDICTEPGCYSYYSWIAATAGGKDTSGSVVASDGYNAAYSICPAGWRLPTATTSNARAQTSPNWKTGDFYALTTAYGANLEYNSKDESSTTGGNFNTNAGPNTIPNFLFGGFYSYSSFNGGSGYWSATSLGNTGASYYLSFGLLSVNSANWSSRRNGFSVRCILRIPANEITFNANGGTIEGSNTITHEVDLGSPLGTLPEPTRENYTFAGWYTEINGGVRVTPDSIPSDDATYYAHWAENSFPVVWEHTGACTFSATVNGNTSSPLGLSGTECDYAGQDFIDTGIKLYSNTNHGKDYEIGFTINSYDSASNVKQATFMNTKMEGNNFPGVVVRKYDSNNAIDISSRKDQNNNARITSINTNTPKTIRIVRKDSILNPEYKAIYYAIDDDDLTEFNDLSVFNPEFDLNVWFGAAPTNASASAAQRYLNGVMSNMYIKIGDYDGGTATTRTINFNANGGTTLEPTRKIIAGYELGTLPAPTRDGYVFEGWWTAAEGGTQIYANTTPTGNTTYYAHWSASYTIIYDANGSEYADDSTSNQVVYTGSSATGTYKEPLDKTGYIFMGWGTASTDVAATYATEDEVKTYYSANPGQTVTLYAVWVVPTTFDDAYSAAGMSIDTTSQKYKMHEMTPAICEAVTTGQTTELVDIRDGTVYSVGKLADNRCWLLDNLAFDAVASKSSLTPENTNASQSAINNFITDGGTAPQAGWTATAVAYTDNTDSYIQPRINIASKDIIPQGGDPLASTALAQGWKVGINYNYCAASIGTYCYDSLYGVDADITSAIDVKNDICPAGWRMPTGGTISSTGTTAGGGEYQVLYDAYPAISGGDKQYTRFRRAFRLPLSGSFYYGSPSNQGSNAFVWSSTFSSNYSIYGLEVDSSSIRPQRDLANFNGLSVRCIADNVLKSLITFNANGGIVDGGNTTAYKIIEGQTLGTLPEPTREGFRFDGWYTQISDGVKISAETEPEGNVTYYAHWSELPTCNPNATTIGTGNSTDALCMQDVASMSKATLASAINNMAAETNYTLKDSRDDQDYTVAKLKDGKVWMTKNMNLPGGTALYSDDSNVAVANTKASGTPYYTLPPSSTAGFSSDSTAYVFNSGNETSICAGDTGEGCYSYYSWIAATAGGMDINGDAVPDHYNAPYSICPAGWRLPISTTGNSYAQSNNNWKTGDFYKLATAYGANLESSYYQNSATFYNNAGPNTTIPNFLFGGYYLNSEFNFGGSRGNYWSATSRSTTSSYSLYFNMSNVYSPNLDNRKSGFSVRCILDYEPISNISEIEYMQDFAKLSSAEHISVLNSMTAGQSYSVKDFRDKKEYHITKLHNDNTDVDYLWMLDNLALSATIDGNTPRVLTSSDSDINPNGVTYTDPSTNQQVTKTTFTMPTELWTSSEQNYYCKAIVTVSSGEYYYNWYAAKANPYVCDTPTESTNATEINDSYSLGSICPAGWTLPNYTSNITATMLNATGNPGALSTSGSFNAGSQGNVGSYGRWWSRVRRANNSVYLLYFGGSSATQGDSVKSLGLSVRCMRSGS